MDNVDKVKLPSAGLLDAPAEVAVRGMRGVEISTIYSSLSTASIDAVIKAVTTPSLDPNILSDEDKQYVLHKTRVLTFGNEVMQTMRCPFCSHIQDNTLNYGDFETTYLTPEEADKTLVLDDEGETILVARIPTARTFEEIETYKTKRNLPDSYAYLLSAASKVESINGSRKSISELVSWLEKIPGKYVIQIAEGLTVKFGLDTTYLVPCEKCKIEYPGGIGLNADMFR